ncbi:unnamed protein product [Mytilus coruscus]|uniref:Uncharacterized protein n=1 Tax=Mytilus coruscus TaxID=42192 RepID=A0A6J8ASF0_MYTCO|nr:unnamed protein product [Mytilus coruscus]
MVKRTQPHVDKNVETKNSEVINEDEVRNLTKVSKVLKNIFTCNFNQLPVEILQSIWFFPQGTGHEMLIKCYNFYIDTQKHTFKVNISDSERKARCVQELETVCKSSTTVLIKTIRISFDLFPKVVSKIPDIKIVHLVRDPRAILHSRKEIGHLDYRPIKRLSRMLCTKMRENIHNYNKLKQGNRFFIKFECLAAYPHIITKTLYSNLSLKYTNQTDIWLTSHTRGNSTSFEKKYEAHVGDSLMLSLKWIFRMPKTVLKWIDRECEDVYTNLKVSDSPRLLQQYQYMNNFNIAKFYNNMCYE